MNPLRQRVKRLMERALPRRLFMTRGQDDGGVALTFDDGPDPEHTPALLDRLRALDVPATFFVIGDRAAQHPALVRRIVDEGHALGHHSFLHGDPRRVSAVELAGEMRRTAGLFARLGLPAPRLFRPPLGKLTAAKTAAIWALGQTIVLWTVDPRDYMRASAAEVDAEIGVLRGGDVVLLHDTVGHTTSILPALAARVRGQGLRFCRVSDWR